MTAVERIAREWDADPNVNPIDWCTEQAAAHELTAADTLALAWAIGHVDGVHDGIGRSIAVVEDRIEHEIMMQPGSDRCLALRDAVDALARKAADR